jgi:hypothetical protein
MEQLADEQQQYFELRVLLLWLAASQAAVAAQPQLLIYNTNSHPLLSDLGRDHEKNIL